MTQRTYSSLAPPSSPRRAFFCTFCCSSPPPSSHSSDAFGPPPPPLSPAAAVFLPPPSDPRPPFLGAASPVQRPSPGLAPPRACSPRPSPSSPSLIFRFGLSFFGGSATLFRFVSAFPLCLSVPCLAFLCGASTALLSSVAADPSGSFTRLCFTFGARSGFVAPVAPEGRASQATEGGG